MRQTKISERTPCSQRSCHIRLKVRIRKVGELIYRRCNFRDILSLSLTLLPVCEVGDCTKANIVQTWSSAVTPRALADRSATESRAS